MVESPNRIHMPIERKGITQRFKIGGLKGYFTVNEIVLDQKPQPGELFISIAKVGGTLSGFANATALLISMCLQYGVPLEVLCKKFIGCKFEPAGWVENPKDIEYAESLLDYIFRWLAVRYLGKEWLDRFDIIDLPKRKP
jgi:ribonucleoside-diphosphate reductase alpha chain